VISSLPSDRPPIRPPSSSASISGKLATAVVFELHPQATAFGRWYEFDGAGTTTPSETVVLALTFQHGKLRLNGLFNMGNLG